MSTAAAASAAWHTKLSCPVCTLLRASLVRRFDGVSLFPWFVQEPHQAGAKLSKVTSVAVTAAQAERRRYRSRQPQAAAMGKAKKTRKFAEVKRMLNPKDMKP